MKYSSIAIALAALVAGCSSTANRDALQIQDPTVLASGFNARQSASAGAVTPQWITTYGSSNNAADLKSIQGRLNALGERKNNYFGDKAQCWIDAAKSERETHDGWGFVSEALLEANRLTTSLETGQGLSVDNPDLRTAAVVRPDLWKQILSAKASPVFAGCLPAQRLTACSEVEMIHAGHEAWIRDFDESTRIVGGVEKRQPELQSALQACATPVAQPVAIPDKVTLQADALFAFDRSDIDGMLPEGRAQLDQLVENLRSVHDVSNIVIDGYTDRLGSDSYNRQLSQKRAVTVQRYLKAGGVTTPMAARGFGKQNPVAQCNQRERAALIKCLEPNRRVELQFKRDGRTSERG